MKKSLQAGCLFVVAALASCAGRGDDAQKSTSQASQAAAPAGQGQPLTLTTVGAGLVQQPTAKGTMVRLQGQFESAVVARRNADGTISTACHDEQAQAQAFMQGAATAPAIEVK
jgi:hypothetical protein